MGQAPTCAPCSLAKGVAKQVIISSDQSHDAPVPTSDWTARSAPSSARQPAQSCWSTSDADTVGRHDIGPVLLLCKAPRMPRWCVSTDEDAEPLCMPSATARTRPLGSRPCPEVPSTADEVATPVQCCETAMADLDAAEASLCAHAEPPVLAGAGRFTVPQALRAQLANCISCRSHKTDSEVLLREFAKMLQAGVGLRLAVEGCGELAMKVSIDPSLATLMLTFNRVSKAVPLAQVRQVLVERLAERVHVRVELEEDRYCIFVFNSTDDGQQEAHFFSSCVRVLAEAARFELVKSDLRRKPLSRQEDTLPSIRSTSIPQTCQPKARETETLRAAVARLEAIASGEASALPKAMTCSALSAASCASDSEVQSTEAPALESNTSVEARGEAPMWE